MSQHSTEENSDELWPTPKAQKIGGYSSPDFRPTLEQVVKDGESDPEAIGGSLNPDWVCWLMGFPDGWLDLKDAGTGSPTSPESPPESPTGLES